MKSKLIIFSIILLSAIMVAGGTVAWFSSSPDPTLTNGEMGIVKVEVISDGLGNICIKNLGKSDCYIRVRLIPQWSDQSLSVSNLDMDINDSDWTEMEGFHYYKDSLEVNGITTNIIKSVDIGELTPEYEGESLSIKVVAEGVQSANEAWKEVWSIDSLPF
ncbi:hypothetical protein [Gudongella sp. SC589]|jgi:hypothetical protein|uniref:hypothetical protein n=1 Tax=Gudongella sp. SC589 TaxID=3385990 RepID=UPI00390472B4